MSQTTLFVCSLCRFSQTESSRNGQSGGEYLIQQLEQELAARQLGDRVHIEPLRCMAACDQSCNASLAAPDKLTFILSQLSPTEDAAAVADFCQQYSDSADGRVSYRQRPAPVQQATAFVLPPLPNTARS